MNHNRQLQFVTLLTLARLPLVILFFGCAIIHAFPSGRYGAIFAIACTGLILAALTDLLDGYFARKFKVTTAFGAHADPLMDKISYLAAMPLLVFVTTRHEQLQGYAVLMLILTLLFLARDQWVSFLRSIGAMYNVSGKANWSGKLRTAINFPMILLVYYHVEAPADLPAIPAILVHGVVGVALVMTVVSLIIYTRQYWPSLRQAARPDTYDPAS